MTEAIRPTYQAIVNAAVDGTGADRGWLLKLADDGLVVVAAVGDDLSATRVGTHRPIEGTAGFVVTSGQPAALQVRGDEANRGAGGAEEIPTSIVAAPCSSGEVLGAIELVDAQDGGFNFDDVELVSLLAEVAGAALAEDDEFRSASATPRELLAALAALEGSDPIRYALVVRAVEALMG